MRLFIRGLVLLAALMVIATLWVANASAQEATTSLHSTVSGNQEQPRVMYIVPWQQPAAADFDFELHNSIAEDLFTPVDRDEFVRELAYRDMLGNRKGEGLEEDAEANGNHGNN